MWAETALKIHLPLKRKIQVSGIVLLHFFHFKGFVGSRDSTLLSEQPLRKI